MALSAGEIVFEQSKYIVLDLASGGSKASMLPHSDTDDGETPEIR